jgi:hypothetical protein
MTPHRKIDRITELIDDHAEISELLRGIHEADGLLRCARQCTACPGTTKDLCAGIHDRFFESILEKLQEHFAAEEVLMRKPDVPTSLHNAFAAHIENHASLVELISRSFLASNPLDQREAIIDMVNAWLSQHLNVHDGVLFDWLQSARAA